MLTRQPVKILIADDHQMFSDALQGLLKPLFQYVYQVKDGLELLFIVKKEIPDLILLDINLPKINGLDAAEKIRHAYPDIKIIILSMYNQQRMIRRAKEMTLEGYLLKDSPFQLLLSAIEIVFKGGHFFDSKLIKEPKDSNSIFDQFMITSREKQIIQALIKGNKAREIAQELGLTYETVKSHRKNIYLKLDVNSIVELVNFFSDSS